MISVSQWESKEGTKTISQQEIYQREIETAMEEQKNTVQWEAVNDRI